MNEDGKSICYCCGSIIFLNPELNPYIVKNNIHFNLENLLFGIIFLIGMILSFFFLIRKSISYSVIGIIYFLTPFLGLFRNAFFETSYLLQEFMDLHRALISGRIKNYDFGSKFFVYSLIFIQAFGILLIVIDLIT